MDLKTTPKRKAMKLDKTHYNDAIVISGINEIKENPEEWLLIKQFRKKKRSLHEATARKGRKSQTEIRRVTVRIRLIIKDFILTIRFQFLERVDILQDLRAMRHI